MSVICLSPATLILTGGLRRASSSWNSDDAAGPIRGSWGCSASPIHLLWLASHLEADESRRFVVVKRKQKNSGFFFAFANKLSNQGHSHKFLKVTRLEMEMKINDFPLCVVTRAANTHTRRHAHSSGGKKKEKRFSRSFMAARTESERRQSERMILGNSFCLFYDSGVRCVVVSYSFIHAKNPFSPL